MRRLLPLAAIPLIAATSACTPAQIAAWVDWHNQDPAAAEEFANTPEIQDLLIRDWDQDGMIEPEPVRRTASTTSTPRGSSGVNWDAVARCESGGQWSHGQVTNRYGTFSGGLMIMNSAWRQFGGTEFAPYAGAASKAEQIIVAERIVARVGFDRAWQCDDR